VAITAFGGFGMEVKRRIMLGTSSFESGFYLMPHLKKLGQTREPLIVVILKKSLKTYAI